MERWRWPAAGLACFAVMMLFCCAAHCWNVELLIGNAEVGCSSSQGMGLDDRLAGLAMMLQCCVVLACGAAGGVCGCVGVSEVDCSSSQGTGLDDRLAWLAVMLLCFSQCCNRSVKLLVGDVRSWSQQAAGVWG